MDTKLIVSASPHLRSEETTQSLMANVIVALCPCVVASAIIFGARALLVTAVSVVACVAFEWLYCKRWRRSEHQRPVRCGHQHHSGCMRTVRPWACPSAAHHLTRPWFAVIVIGSCSAAPAATTTCAIGAVSCCSSALPVP